MYTPEDYKRISGIEFEKLLNYLNIKYSKLGNRLTGKIEGKEFSVNIPRNLYWIDENDRGNVISFLAKVRNCNNSVAAKELDEQFFNNDTEDYPQDTDSKDCLQDTDSKDCSKEISQKTIIIHPGEKAIIEASNG